MATSSSTSTNGPKISMLKAKTGFVIPKNKLSGSLVPAFKGVKKSEGSDVAQEESTKQVQRKTKWGPDLTQDAAVRRGRALAYQTRVDQITQLLKSGSLASRNGKSSTSAANVPDHERSSQRVEDENAQQLEKEKQEAIGEIVKLNPSYKVPSNYKPLTREARVPLPAKGDAGYNFVSLVFGPGSDTQKRVEKETGAVIQVYGTKSEGGNKVEVTASDGSELLSSYKDLYVLVSADSYDKVDAAVILIELLVASVSGKSASVAPSASGDNMRSVSKSQDAVNDPLTSAALHNQGSEQSVMGSVATPQGHIQPNPNPWLQMVPFQTPNFIHPPNSSLPVASNTINVSPFPFNPSNMPSLPGPRSGQGLAFSPAPHNSNFMSPRSQPPLLVSPNTFTSLPRPSGQVNTPSSQPLLVQSNSSAAFLFSGNQLPRVPGPVGSSVQNSISGFPAGQLPERPINPAGNTGWGPAPVSRPNFMGPTSAMQMAPPVSAPPASASPLPPLQAGLPLASSTPLTPRPLHGPVSMPSQIQPSASMLVQQFGQVPNTPNNPTLGSTPVPRPAPSTVRPVLPGMPGFSPGGIPAPSFTPLRSMAGGAPGAQQTVAGDFTFQHNRPHLSPHPAPRASGHSGPQGPPPSGMQLPPAPLSLSPAMQGVASQPMMQAPARPPVGNQMGLQLPPASYRGNAGQIPPPNMNVHMAVRNASLFPQSPNAGAPFLPQPGNSAPFQQGLPPPPLARPGNPFPPNQGFSNNLPIAAARPASGSSGGQHIYDPFSPTSVPQHQGGNLGNVRRQESDPEYEDLMASVGVK